MSADAGKAEYVTVRVKNTSNEIGAWVSCDNAALGLGEHGLQLRKLTLIALKRKKFRNVMTFGPKWFTSCYSRIKVLKFLV